jgi:hypothetical protein
VSYFDQIVFGSSPKLAGNALETQLETQMNVAAECRAKAQEKIRQATQDKRHRRKLLSAAEAWLFLAERLDELDHVTVASEVA